MLRAARTEKADQRGSEYGVRVETRERVRRCGPERVARAEKVIVRLKARVDGGESREVHV